MVMAILVLSSSIGVAVNFHECYVMDIKEMQLGDKKLCCEKNSMDCELTEIDHRQGNSKMNLNHQKIMKKMISESIPCEFSSEHLNVDVTAKNISVESLKLSPTLFVIFEINFSEELNKNNFQHIPQFALNQVRLNYGRGLLSKVQSFIL